MKVLVGHRDKLDQKRGQKRRTVEEKDLLEAVEKDLLEAVEKDLLEVEERSSSLGEEVEGRSSSLGEEEEGC